MTTEPLKFAWRAGRTTRVYASMGVRPDGGRVTNPAKGEDNKTLNLHPQLNLEIECDDDATLDAVLAVLERMRGVRVTVGKPGVAR